jgi:hypothetical protein
MFSRGLSTSALAIVLLAIIEIEKCESSWSLNGLNWGLSCKRRWSMSSREDGGREDSRKWTSQKMP